MTAEQWVQISRTIDFILKQPTGAEQGIKGEPERIKRKPKQPKKPKPEPKAEQLRLF
jgi:hypothetical protein